MRTFFAIGMIGLAGSVLAAPDESAPHWEFCSNSTTLQSEFAVAVARIASAVGRDERHVALTIRPVGKGSISYLLAISSGLLNQLKNSLLTAKVPLRRVIFQWELEASAPEAVDSKPVCDAVKLHVALEIGDE